MLRRDGDDERASQLASRMVEFDGGVSVAGLYILAGCHERAGRIEAVRDCLERALDASSWDTCKRSIPRPYSFMHEAVRHEARKYPVELVDLPAVFKEYLGGRIPGRSLVIDYVHLRIRPESTAKRFKEALDQGYVRIEFTNSGTELGVKLDRDASDFSAADFEGAKGTARIVGGLTLDYVKVRCVADIDLATLAGQGRLERAEAEAGRPLASKLSSFRLRKGSYARHVRTKESDKLLQRTEGRPARGVAPVLPALCWRGRADLQRLGADSACGR